MFDTQLDEDAASWCIARNEAWSRFGGAEFGSRGASNRRLERAFRIICAGLTRDGKPSPA